MAAVADAAVAAWRPLCAELAEKHAAMASGKQRRGQGRGEGEFDDLEQEGMIACWQSLARGIPPTVEIIEDRMASWVSWLNRRRPTDYHTALPLDDYAEVPA